LRRWLTGTFSGLALVGGSLTKLVAFLLGAASGQPDRFEFLDTLGDIALVAGAAVLLYRLFVDAKRLLLWRVRRKLMLSYFFIGFVPVLLIVTFFLLGGVLLLVNLMPYIVESRVGELVREAALLSDITAADLERSTTIGDARGILARHQAVAARRYPQVSYALVQAPRCTPGFGGRASTEGSPREESLAAGPWAHTSPPAAIPAWVDCAGQTVPLVFTDESRRRGERAPGVFVHRSVVWPGGALSTYAVVVDLPVTREVREQLHQDTGIELLEFSVRTEDGNVLYEPVAPPDAQDADDTRGSAAAEGGGFLNRNMQWFAFLDRTEWDSGTRGDPFAVAIRTSLVELYQRLMPPEQRMSGAPSLAQILMLLLAVVGVLLLVIQLVALGMGVGLARSITGSVHELFVGTERVRRGDFTHKISIRSRDQLGELADSFNSMTGSIEDLLQEKAEKERLEQELRIARSIQMSLLPQRAFAMPGLALTAHCEPAREVGGDYYDYLPIDSDRLGVLIADVSGKGTSAALYMAELKGVVLSLSEVHASPRDLLIHANRILSRHLDARSFITVTYGVIDLGHGTLRYARAGHCPMIFMPGPHAAPREPRILAPDGMVVGLQLDDGQLFARLLEEATVPLAPGDLCLLYTDGLTEAANPDGDLFGDERLATLVAAHADLSSDELRERILREVRAFAGSTAQQDDMTMVLLKVEA
jgi:serine phosphatase RsbU (regulator of sigma subunit)